MAEFNDHGFAGPFIELCAQEDGDDRTLQIGRDRETGLIAIVAGPGRRYTLSEEVKQQLIKWLEAL